MKIQPDGYRLLGIMITGSVIGLLGDELFAMTNVWWHGLVAVFGWGVAVLVVFVAIHIAGRDGLKRLLELEDRAN